MNEEENLLKYLKDENWKYFHEDGVPYKTIFMQERDILIKYITQLQDNWNELKKWCKENQYIGKTITFENDVTYTEILDKMQEMENGNNDI